MLLWLAIKNLVLVKECTIGFQKGFNVLTGESGAGKSVILSALSLVLGQKQESSQIRHGEESAVVEATFDDIPHELYTHLDSAGISYDKEEPIIIRRELSLSGKTRAFVNNSAVTLSFLKTLAPFLAQICSQHAATQLFDLKLQLKLLDTFAELGPLLRQFRAVHSRCSECKKEIEAIVSNHTVRNRQIETARREIEEIEAAAIQEGEDEELFTAFTEKSNALELVETLHEINASLDNQLSGLSKVRHGVEKLSKLSIKAKGFLESFSSGYSELHDLSFELTKWQQEVESSPDELSEIDARLKEIDRLKKKYGESLAEIMAYKETQVQLLYSLEHMDARLEELQSDCSKLQKEEDDLAHTISQKRFDAAQRLSKEVTKELAELNMKTALFEISLIPCARNSMGDETVQFFLTPNVGLQRIIIEEAASGGELSRIVLAIQCALAERAGPVLLVFDEIDANIGGQTASIIGQKLSKLAFDRQVIAITHFAQVASCANSHYRIWKEESLGTTLSHIEELSTSGRENEVVRMHGGKL
jgi:DNA repair protein RecN (Recombination protein N)